LKKHLNSILKFLFFLAIGILLIWLAVRNLTEEDKTSISKAFSEANYFWIFVSTVLSGLSHLTRAARWKLLIQPLGINPKLSNTFFALMVGYLANLAIPRLGEVSRCGVLAKYEKISFTEAFGTVIAERAIDLLCLILLFVGTLIFLFDELWTLTNEKILIPLTTKFSSMIHHPLFIGVSVVFIALVFLLFWWLLKSNKGGILFKKIKDFALGFWEGLKSVKNIKRPYLFVFYTVLIWFLYTIVLSVAFFCFEETSHLGFGAAMATMLFGSLGILFVPGGTGAYQALATETLTTAFKMSFAVAFAFAWLIWTTQFVFLLLLGVISLILLPVLNKQAK
jgi:uncharacterized protein (TIRG00374 family)